MAVFARHRTVRLSVLLAILAALVPGLVFHATHTSTSGLSTAPPLTPAQKSAGKRLWTASTRPPRSGVTRVGAWARRQRPPSRASRAPPSALEVATSSDRSRCMRLRPCRPPSTSGWDRRHVVTAPGCRSVHVTDRQRFPVTSWGSSSPLSIPCAQASAQAHKSSSSRSKVRRDSRRVRECAFAGSGSLRLGLDFLTVVQVPAVRR